MTSEASTKPTPEDSGTFWDRISPQYQAENQIRSDDFHYAPLLPGNKELRILPPLQAGQRALELGAGAGQNSIFLASQGLHCTATDYSREQLRRGRRIAQEQGQELDFVWMDMDRPYEDFPAGWDLIHSTYALPFSRAPEEVVKWSFEHLNPGGHLVLSLGHPVYTGEWLEIEEDPGVFLTSYFCPATDERSDGSTRVCSQTWPISTVFNWLRSAGFEVLRLEEPAPAPVGTPVPYTSTGWEELRPILEKIPLVFIVLARKR